MKRTLSIIPITVVLFIFTSAIIASQQKDRKGLVLENAPARPCGNTQQSASVGEGAKGLFFDPSSGAIVSPNSQKKPALTKPRHGQNRVEPKPQTVTNTGLKYWIELIEPGGVTKRVAKERVFRTGERIRFHFESNVDGYIAMTLIDESCQAKTLFPSQKVRAGDNFIQRSKDYILPSEEAWFKFDQESGVERILIFFSQSRQIIDQLQLKPSMDSRTVAMLTSKAETGSKGLSIEIEDDASHTQPAAYFVNPSTNPKSYVAMEICLNHAP